MRVFLCGQYLRMKQRKGRKKKECRKEGENVGRKKGEEGRREVVRRKKNCGEIEEK